MKVTEIIIVGNLEGQGHVQIPQPVKLIFLHLLQVDQLRPPVMARRHIMPDIQTGDALIQRRVAQGVNNQRQITFETARHDIVDFRLRDPGIAAIIHLAR